ncbi:hypothetical protein [Scytonema sp. PCC 10023]|uniref:hypothetical protein n=1 Tax=Scytonema sp. PCC 10023 TaxID=1680591 RepID=UPI0039C5AA2D
MKLKVFPLLGTPCKRLIMRRKHPLGKRSGQTYHYRPQTRLINRLAQELEMSPQSVRQQIAQERLYLLRQYYGTEIGPQDV